MNNIIKGIKLILSGLLSPFKSMNLLSNINNRIKDCNNIHSHRIDSINKDISFIKEQIDGLIKSEYNDSIRIKELSNRINNQLSLIRDIEDKLESTDVPVDLGEFNFINTADETDELLQIEAEMLGSSVAKEEYDWHCEQKAKNKQIQDRMRADEAEFIND